MLAIATESIVKLVAFLAVGVFVTFWMFDGPVAAVRPGAGAAAHRGRAHPRAAVRHPARDDAAVVRRDHAAAAAVPRHGGREQQRGRDPARRLAVSALSRADQPVRGADRARRPARPSRRRRSTATCSCWRCRSRPAPSCSPLAAFIGGLSAATAMVIVEIGRARHHGVERPRRAAACCKRREALLAGTRRCRRAAADGAADRDLRHPAASPTCITARPARRSSPRSACCPSPPSRSSRPPSSAACSGGAAPRAARSPA